MIKENSDQSNELLAGFEIVLNVMQDFFCITYKAPVHEIARRLMGEVKEFEPVEEERRSSSKPRATK